MKADKTNPWPICNYATFLWDIKKDFENAEKVEFYCHHDRLF
jgi:hypothetical protein